MGTTLNNMKHLVQYAEWIEQTLPSTRKKNVKILQPKKNDNGEMAVQHPSFTPLILAYKSVAILQGAICQHAPLTATCGNLGKTVLAAYIADTGEEIDAVQFVDIGYWLINVLFDQRKLNARRGRHERDPYTIEVNDDDFIDALLLEVNSSELKIQLHTKPVFEKPIPYTKFHHPVAGELVHKCNPKAKPYFTYDNCPIVFDAINKHMSTPLKVNTDVLEVFLKSKKDPLFSFADKAQGVDQDTWKEQFVGLKREQTAILDTAVTIGNRVFYQYMFYDFRGRLYSCLIYFNPQGSKLAKSLIKFATEEPIGSEGWYWLLIHTANCRGWDKLPLDERYEKAEKYLDAWMKIAADPVKNKQWQVADDPHCFLAAIMEIYKAINYKGGKENFPSGLMVAWDATCSGLQVLSALVRDEKAGDLCNLTNNGERGDYYLTIAEDVWQECVYEEDELPIFDEVVEALANFDKRISKCSNKKLKSEIYEERAIWLIDNREKVRAASRIFWGRPEIAKLKRKLVKRPCMTYFYSCQAKTMAKSLLSDFRNNPKFKGIQLTFCLWLTSRIYKSCQINMPITTKMMEAFIKMGLKAFSKTYTHCLDGDAMSFATMARRISEEMIKEKGLWEEYKQGDQEWRAHMRKVHGVTETVIKAGIEGNERVTINEEYDPENADFKLTGPFNKFLFMQNYKTPVKKKVKFTYRNKQIRLSVIVGNNGKLDYNKIFSATAPNAVHMEDSQLVSGSIMYADYDINCIHDSFSASPANAGKLFEDIRQVFVDIFEKDELARLEEESGYITNIEVGKLNIYDVLDDLYSFN